MPIRPSTKKEQDAQERRLCERSYIFTVSQEGFVMEDFGLAKVKSEGAIVNYDDGMPGNGAVSETRWIEMCYDPEENMNHIDIEPFREVFQTQQSCNSYTEDDIYLIIKAIANEFVKD